MTNHTGHAPAQPANPYTAERYQEWRQAQRVAGRVAANYYKIQLGDAFFRRLHNTWTAL